MQVLQIAKTPSSKFGSGRNLVAQSSSKEETEFTGLVIRTGLTRTQKTSQHWSHQYHMNHTKHHQTTTFIMKGSDWQLGLSSDLLIISPGQV
jgi:hypothetical protein